MDSRIVHLYVTEELINDLGKEQKVDSQHFVKAVKKSVGEMRGGLCQKALDNWDNWQY